MTEPAARALSRLEFGDSAADIHQRIAAEFDPGTADRVLRDIQSLESLGMLEVELEMVDAEKLRDYKRLLSQQPRNIMLFVTEACNLACTYCYEKNQGVHDAPDVLRQVDARIIIDKYFDASPRRQGLTVTFFGGEPLLNWPVVRDTVEYVKAKARVTGQQVGFTMTTNLTLLTEEMAEFLAREKFHVMVSIDGDKADHDRHRRTRTGKPTYDVVVRNLRLLIDRMRAARVRLPKIRATMTGTNFDVDSAERHLRSLGTPLVEVGESHGKVDGKSEYDVSYEPGREGPIALNERRIAAMLDSLQRRPDVMPEVPSGLAEALRRIHNEVNMPAAHTAVRPRLCGVNRNMKAVTPNGDMYPCHRYVGMSAFCMGNVHDGGLNAHRVQEYYESLYSLFADKCAPCWLRHLCGGQCPWYLSDASGRISAPDEATCDIIRARYERNMGLYARLLRDYPDTLGAIVGQSRDDPGSPASAPDEACGS